MPDEYYVRFFDVLFPVRFCCFSGEILEVNEHLQDVILVVFRKKST